MDGCWKIMRMVVVEKADDGGGGEDALDCSPLSKLDHKGLEEALPWQTISYQASTFVHIQFIYKHIDVFFL